ncbi:DUF4873 domain-containing protein [Allokutzneria multivorans]|uniref:DUF4873 domain-containing protein n=1 Tax=Allokutzneria multivorans TaxID=1142134 RepID=A0ABP7U7X8_9PSEU
MAEASTTTTAHEEHDDHDEDGYAGPATLITKDGEAEVEVRLAGHFEPIDGRYHWYGRVNANDKVTEAAEKHRRAVVLRTPHGEAEGALSDQDPWGRFRITGLGRPPFEVLETLPDED